MGPRTVNVKRGDQLTSYLTGECRHQLAAYPAPIYPCRRIDPPLTLDISMT